ncbi:hypothetical protein LX15_002695 [Streptoalloteichus tenebrarius]|uniref:SurA-like protein n=1 Tax=Streptoalloteichus tenebrarius (strain ATCC 17920 / DSM 40477 / JCM 4838 / CBS 697.72 / NBRC 16177 / NCIMB 11028 / NRRL B-12390 / A12253. 1 / ISP 5477) TaxID=1933 RepID=A0ABT1HU27_STRSD|nr:hypothetical protein [Streptoalloteichus tenebrarius]MCP2258996.1 hypothetical protein [Streptoalloteichus tenebrarius]BFF01206.1 hypothetical protein GCM10020241_28810 [Streptoalloteichus tenebrarius]
MTTAIRRPARLLALVVAAGALLVGCGSGPSQVGAAAVIGDSTIPLDHVRQRLDSVFHKDPDIKSDLRKQGTLDVVARNIVTLSVRHDLIGRAADREGLSYREEQVSELIDKQGGAEAASRGTVYDEHTFRERAADQLLLVELGKKYLDRLSITVDYTQAGSRKAAEEKARQLANDPERARDVIAKDRASGVPAGLNERLRASDNLQLASTPLFSAEKGTVLAFPVSDRDGQWLVAVVRERSLSDGASGGVDVKQLDPRQLEAIGLRMLAPLSEELGVRVNPRYGVWDPMSLAAVANPEETGGFRFPPRERAQ